MPKVVLYCTMFCPYCSGAKRLLTKKGMEFEEIDVTFAPGKRSEMIEKAGGLTSVPQIWIGDTHVGGCDELFALEDEGRLDGLLSRKVET